MTTADIERKTGVPRSTLYFYIRKGLIPEPQRTPGGRALYAQEHVELLLSIGELKREGRSLEEIKRALDTDVARVRDTGVDLAAQENDRVHAAIIETATKEFRTNGYKRTHVAAIIERLGINPQLFYSHFPSKLHLLAECFNTIVQGSVDSTEPEMDQYADPAEKALRRLAVDNWTHDIGAMLAAALRLDGAQDDIEQYGIEESLGSIMARVTADITSVRAPGSPPTKVPEELLAYGLLGAHRFQRMRVSWAKGFDMADFLRAHLYLYLAVLAAVRGEVDIEGRVAEYEDLIQAFSAQMPETRPTFEG